AVVGCDRIGPSRKHRVGVAVERDDLVGRERPQPEPTEQPELPREPLRRDVDPLLPRLPLARDAVVVERGVRAPRQATPLPARRAGGERRALRGSCRAPYARPRPRRRSTASLLATRASRRAAPAEPRLRPPPRVVRLSARPSQPR